MSASHEQIVAAITGIVTEELGLAAGSVTPSADLRSMQGADSVKVLRMIARIERHYDVELDDEDIFTLSSIHDVALVVAGALALDPA
ncbi:MULTISPECIES: acyl carrier protein [unclassified Frankia]|uniref:acyl carrier protein n=1 Tax=unclassified Frankia TaxID=2632575 RepID=UPI001EF5C1A9|nr:MULTISPECIES: acyl carrier protein [unclassified Frankia]